MKHLRRSLVLSAVTLAFSLAVQAQPTPTKTPLKFGLAMPLTGSQALFGADQAKAAQWAVQDINAKGGIDGHPLEMVLLDTQADPRLGTVQANATITAVQGC